MHVIRVVPTTTADVLGRSLQAGDCSTPRPARCRSSTAAGDGDGTRWVATTMATPTGVAVAPSGALFYADAGADTVREIEAP